MFIFCLDGEAWAQLKYRLMRKHLFSKFKEVMEVTILEDVHER